MNLFKQTFTPTIKIDKLVTLILGTVFVPSLESLAYYYEKVDAVYRYY